MTILYPLRWPLNYIIPSKSPQMVSISTTNRDSPRVRRFQAVRTITPTSVIWSLAIREVGEGDAGLYECQVAALTKLARSLELRVVTPRVQVTGGGAETRELHVNQGGGVTLRCVITGVTESPAFVTWYFNNKVSGALIIFCIMKVVWISFDIYPN